VANVSSIVTTDEDEDGRVDTATIVFTDEMKDSTFAPADFTIGGVLATSFSTGSTPDDATVILSHAGVAGTEAKTVAYNAGTVTDLAGNVRGSFSSGSTDEAKPVLLSARTTSVTEIEATFSEDLDGTTVNGTGNEFTVSGYAVSAASETAPGVITLTVATMPTDATPIVTYTANSLLNDKAIVPNTAVTPTSVTAVDEVAPTLSSVTISSDNDGDILDPEWAKVGDTATLTFTSSEAIATPTVTIDGMSATVSGGPTAWSAAYTFVGGESDGTVPFSITLADLAAPTPNVGITVTATGDGSTVFFDEVAPSVDAGTDKEVNAVVAQDAAVSDPAPASGIATYLWTNQTPGVGTITFGSATAEDTTISADTDGTYTIRLTVTDNAGNSQFDEMIFIWDTTNPEPLTSSPSDGLTGVAITAGTAMVTYDEPIVLLDNSRVLIVRDSDGASFKGAVAVSGLSQTVLNVDYTGLAFGTKYRINVKPNALEDVAGNNLATNFISYFTTEIDTIPPVVNSFSASSITTTGATLNVTTDESATCSYATTDSAYSSMTAFDGPNTGTSHTAVLSGLTSSTGHDYFVRCADTTAETNTMTTSAHVSFTTLTPDTTGPVISNIQTGSITQTGVTITWTTDEDATDRVEYGLTSSYGSMSGVDTIADNTSHSVSLTGLTAGTVYHFRVLSSDAIPNAETSVDGTFRTSEPDPDTVAPPVPSIITGAASVNSDSYQISGNAGADTPTPTVRTISLYNGATLVGTAVVPIGQTGWSVSVTLTQDTANSFNAVSADAFGNVSDASSPVVITEDATVGADTTPPADPTFTTVDTTIDADTYELTGFAGEDDGVRTITIKNSDGVVVGTAILPEGDEDWAIEVVLEQDASNTFFVTSMDASGNLSNSDDVTITEESTPDITPPVITLLGVNPQTLTVGDSYVELGATASDDMDGDISADLDIDSTAVNMAEVGTYTVTYNVSDASSNGATEETRTVIVEAAFDDTALLVVTGIDAVKTYATADDSYANGWSWVYHITVPTNETSFKMKFSDFISGLNSILAANNIRFYSSQSSAHADQGHAIDITASNSYSAVAILDTDLDSATAGRQIEVTVEMKVPLSSAGGSYSGSYGIFSEI